MPISMPSYREEAAPPSATGRSRYRVVVAITPGRSVDADLRALVARARGELYRLAPGAGGDPSRRQLHLGRRRFDDVVAALNAADFPVDAVIAQAG